MAVGAARSTEAQMRGGSLVERCAVRCVRAGLLVESFARGARADREHTVGPGQTLSRIAERYGVSAAALAAANGLSRGDPIRPGQVLVVPPRGVVYASAGDSLASIARRHELSPDELA